MSRADTTRAPVGICPAIVPTMPSNRSSTWLALVRAASAASTSSDVDVANEAAGSACLTCVSTTPA